MVPGRRATDGSLARQLPPAIVVPSCHPPCRLQDMANRDRDYWRRERDTRGEAWSGGGAAFAAWMASRPAPGRRRRWAHVAAIGLIYVGLIASILAAPLALTGADDSCTALETALFQRTPREVAGAKHQQHWPGLVGDRDGGSRTGGATGRRIAALEHRWMPAFAGCTALFWQVRVSAVSG